MPLNTPEQILFDYIESNPEVKEYWGKIISSLTGSDESTISNVLRDKLHQYYWENPINLEPIAFILGPNGLLHADLINVANALLKKELTNERPDIVLNNKKQDLIQKTYFILRTGAKSGPYTLGQLVSMWKSGNITADTMFWSEASRDWVSIKELIENSNDSHLNLGSKENPIPIISLLTMMESTMNSAVDKLYGAYNWKKVGYSGDLTSMRWNILLGDGSSREVWFDIKPSKSLRLSNLDKSHPSSLKTLNPRKQKELGKILQQSLTSIDFNSDHEIRNRLRKGEKEGGGSLKGALMAFLMIISFLVGVASLLYGLIFLAAISVMLLYLFQKLSKYFNTKETSRFYSVVQKKLDAAYNEYKRSNPVEKLTESGDEESERAEFRKCWAIKHDFQLPEEIK
jgi:hypothetical protein